jgi:hypothetical protein
MNGWTLIDCLPMVADEEDLPRIAVQSEGHLREELDRYRQRQPPSIIELVSPEGETLYMGIGSALSGIQWMKEAQNPLKKQLRMAVADHPYSAEGMEFRYQGSASGFRSKYLLPVEKTIDAAVHYFKTQKLPDWLQWAEWNPQTHRLEVPPADQSNGIPTLVLPRQEGPERIVHLFCPNCTALLSAPREGDVEQVCPHCGAQMKITKTV